MTHPGAKRARYPKALAPALFPSKTGYSDRQQSRPRRQFVGQEVIAHGLEDGLCEIAQVPRKGMVPYPCDGKVIPSGPAKPAAQRPVRATSRARTPATRASGHRGRPYHIFLFD
jgi:hypothetical protein